MKTKDIHHSEAVDQHIKKYEPDLQDIINRIRTIILGIDPLIAEQIKWNSPSFFYSGEMKPFDAKEYKRDLAVLNLHRGSVLMVMPTGARVVDSSGILEGNYADGRRLIRINDMDDLNYKEEAIKAVISAWLLLVE